jgi:hypothetical protein
VPSLYPTHWVGFGSERGWTMPPDRGGVKVAPAHIPSKAGAWFLL